MISSLRRAMALAMAAALVITPATAQSATQPAGAITTMECYSAPDPLVEFGSWTFQASGYCQSNCTGLGEPVMAITGGSTCYCGSELPPKDKIVDSSNCNRVCSGFGDETCGGIGFWQVYLTGLTANVHRAPNSSSSSTTADGTSKPAVVTQPGQTVTLTNLPSNDDPQKSSDGPNKIGIAVGVVVGVLALAAIIGVVVFIIKRKRNREIEEEHRRNAAVNSFVARSDKSSTDQRLDPSIFSADSMGRQSIGSIADERDFSRRILQVRNPDRESRSSAFA